MTEGFYTVALMGTPRNEMDTVARLGRLAKMVASRPGNLRRGLQALYDSYEMDSRRTHVAKAHGLAGGLPTASVLDLIPQAGETVEPYSFLYGMSPPLDIALLVGLARRFERCSYLEIGSWRGESLANVARVAGECVSVSLSPDEMRRFGMTEDEVRTLGFFTRGLANVRHVEHDSHTLDWAPYKGKFDLVFIDGDHSYDGVRADTANAFPLLRDDSSLIVWHDYGLSPETVNWRVLAGILDGCPADRRNDLYHVSNTLCAIYSRKRLEARREEYAQIPSRRFSVQIRGEPI
jgi:predicted O-methyltransferase YrrM